MDNLKEEVNVILYSADILRDVYRHDEYYEVIIPFTFLKLVEIVLEYSKGDIIEYYNEFRDDYGSLHFQLLEKAVDKEGKKLGFYNYSQYDLKKLIEDHHRIEQNLNDYLNCFSVNIQDIFEYFNIKYHIAKLANANRLYPLINQFLELNLHWDNISNQKIGIIFEELIEKFAESNRVIGEHSTPRNVINLMTSILFENEIHSDKNTIKSIYDPACGTGGMLINCKNYLKKLNNSTEIKIFGQELNKEAYAICKANMLIGGENSESIKEPSSTLSNDQFPENKFDFIISHLPFNKSWIQDKRIVMEEAEKSFKGRFGAGIPRIKDGQLLFVQHMISKMKDNEKSRISVITTRSPLFIGNMGSGESNIRKWIIENDYLETIISLPERLFYNTGIKTYIWILTNKKSEDRVGKIQLIDASSKFQKTRKINFISEEDMDSIMELYTNFEENENSRIFDNEEFGYIRIKKVLKDNTKSVFEKIPLKQHMNECLGIESLANQSCDLINITADEIGYKINFTETFYKYHPPISLDENIPLKQLSNIITIGNFNEEDIIMIPATYSKEVMLKSEFKQDNMDYNYDFECKINDKNTILPQYLKLFLNSELGKYQRELFAHDSVSNRINNGGIKSIYVAIPDLETQKKIIDVGLEINGRYNETVSLNERFNKKIFNFEDLLFELSKEDKSLDRYLESDETDEIEFKSSLMWDVKENKVNKDLTKVVFKTIAGFLNTNGGTLLIGVEDNKNIYGIENDINSLSRKDRDGFEQYFSQMLTNYLGTQFSKYLKLKYEEKNQKEVCIVQIEPSSKPVFLKEKKKKKFYMRSLNTTRPLEKKEDINEYIDIQWKDLNR